MAQVFHVLTEFRFDVASAVANSKVLQAEVQNVSSAASNAISSLQNLGLSVVKSMMGAGGVVGALGIALKASDKFGMSQRALANIFLSNNMFEGANGFERAMSASAAAMENMRKAANDFSLPVSEMIQFSKLVGASLISHGLDDSSMRKSVDLSRGFLKPAPILGIDPGLAKGQLLDAVMGRANMGDTLFQRLMNETSAMKPYAGTAGAKAFNALEPSKRLDVLTKSLMQFGSNAKVVDANAKSLGQQMQRLSDNFLSAFSVLKPLGDAIIGPIQDLLLQVNQYVETKGKTISQNMGKILGQIFESPERLLLGLLTLKDLQRDVTRAGNILSFIGAFHALNWLLGMAGVSLKAFVRPGLELVIAALKTFWSGLSLAWPAIMKFGMFIGRFVLLPLGALIAAFQLLSMAIAKANVYNFKWLAANADLISAIAARVSKAFMMIISPITMAIDGLSDIVSVFFRFDLTGGIILALFDALATAMNGVGIAMVGLMSVISGFVSNIAEIVLMVIERDFSNFRERMNKAYWEGFDMIWNKYKPFDPMFPEQDQAVSNRITNIGKVEIRNEFKEQMEPDRIAFTLVEQLQKAAMNPTRAAGGAFRGSQLGR